MRLEVGQGQRFLTEQDPLLTFHGIRFLPTSSPFLDLHCPWCLSHDLLAYCDAALVDCHAFPRHHGLPWPSCLASSTKRGPSHAALCGSSLFGGGAFPQCFLRFVFFHETWFLSMAHLLCDIVYYRGAFP